LLKNDAITAQAISGMCFSHRAFAALATHLLLGGRERGALVDDLLEVSDG